MGTLMVSSNALDYLEQVLRELINKCYAHIIKEINTSFSMHAETTECDIDDMVRDIDTVIATKSLQTKDLIKMEINKLRKEIVVQKATAIPEEAKDTGHTSLKPITESIPIIKPTEFKDTSPTYVKPNPDHIKRPFERRDLDYDLSALSAVKDEDISDNEASNAKSSITKKDVRLDSKQDEDNPESTNILDGNKYTMDSNDGMIGNESIKREEEMTVDRNNNKQLTCPYHRCLFVGPTLDKMIEHAEAIHTKKRNYVCSFCGKDFYESRDLNNHINNFCPTRKKQKLENGETDEGEQSKVALLLECEHCPYTNKRRTHMNRHIDAVHKKIRNFSCNFCEKGFTMKHHLNTHMNSCQKKFLSVPELFMNETQDEYTEEMLAKFTADD